MDRRLKIVERLYERGPDGLSEHPIGSEAGEELLSEYHAMSQAKFWLDHRRAQRPDGATIDRIVAAAVEATVGDLPQSVQAEGQPLRLLKGAPLRMVAAAAVAIAAVSIGLWRTADSPPMAPEQSETNESRFEMADRKSAAPPASAANAAATESEEEDIARSERRERISGEAATPQVGESRLKVSSGLKGTEAGGRLNEPAALLATIEPSGLPEWTHPDEFVQIRQRIEQLKVRQSDLGWDKPLIPLEIETMPTGGGDAALRQAGVKE